ncbi:hypothetical protein pb186bvf_005161 [Paramecium bursaria]
MTKTLQEQVLQSIRQDNINSIIQFLKFFQVKSSGQRNKQEMQNSSLKILTNQTQIQFLNQSIYTILNLKQERQGYYSVFTDNIYDMTFIQSKTNLLSFSQYISNTSLRLTFSQYQLIQDQQQTYAKLQRTTIYIVQIKQKQSFEMKIYKSQETYLSLSDFNSIKQFLKFISNLYVTQFDYYLQMNNISSQCTPNDSQYLVYSNLQHKQRKTRPMRVSGFLNNIDLLPSNYQPSTKLTIENNDAQSNSLPIIHIQRIKLQPLQLSETRMSCILTDQQQNLLNDIKINSVKNQHQKLPLIPKQYKKQVVFRNSVQIVDLIDGSLRNEVIDGQKKPIRRLKHKKSQTLCK